MNGFVDQHLWQKGRNIYEAVQNTEDPIDQAFRAILVRAPTPEERQAADQLAADYGVRDVVWSLVNTHEFMFFH